MPHETPDDQPSIDGTRLTRDRYLQAWDADLDALAEAAGDLAREVPSCPGWTVRDLVEHVVGVYRHKIVALETDAAPPQRDDAWGALAADDDPVAVLRSTYADLRALLVARPDPDTDLVVVAGRADSGLLGAADGAGDRGAPLGRRGRGVRRRTVRAPVDDDLATDGVDELLGWLARGSGRRGATGRRGPAGAGLDARPRLWW
jgi:hypothetical protein